MGLRRGLVPLPPPEFRCCPGEKKYVAVKSGRCGPGVLQIITSCTCICEFVIFALVKRLIAIPDSAGIVGSTIQSPVCLGRRNAKYGIEQKRNPVESAIRLRFVLALTSDLEEKGAVPKIR